MVQPRWQDRTLARNVSLANHNHVQMFLSWRTKISTECVILVHITCIWADFSYWEMEGMVVELQCDEAGQPGTRTNCQPCLWCPKHNFATSIVKSHWKLVVGIRTQFGYDLIPSNTRPISQILILLPFKRQLTNNIWGIFAVKYQNNEVYSLDTLPVA